MVTINARADDVRRRPLISPMHDFPYTTFATGWYQVAWSEEVAPETAIPLRYFGKELVCYRGASSRVYVSDAFCPHLGAHLGHGGRVDGDCLVCPFHGWTWDGDGKNVEIPYSPPSKMRLRIRHWPVLEVNGVVLVWYAADGETPWELPPFLPAEASPDDYWPTYPILSRVWKDVGFPPQVVAENSCDAAHFRYVHRADEVPTVVDFNAGEHIFRTEIAIRFGAGRPSTWATPNGPVDGLMSNEVRGLGLVVSAFSSFDMMYTLASTTPIDHHRSDHRATVWVPRRRSDGSPLDEAIRDRWAKEQFSQHAADFQVWENMTYVAKPPLARSEGASFRALREWTHAQYPGAQPTVASKARVPA
jgi:3-ketosteroid 9alpha-monooxygenase subunit A